ncbi:nuclease-like domain protein [Leptospira interrogans serovar Bataviae str. HAI135]|nr:nuclease-like domain protein [Leptospira interrogans serovar Bataviae str. HAI135]
MFGVSAPELGKPEGDEAFESLKNKLKPGTNLLIRTHLQDKYGRYLGDVLYLLKKNLVMKHYELRGFT